MLCSEVTAHWAWIVKTFAVPFFKPFVMFAPSLLNLLITSCLLIPIWLSLVNGKNMYVLPLYLLWITQLDKIMKRCIILCHLWSIVFSGDSGVSCKTRCLYRNPDLRRHEHKEPVYLLTFEIQGKLLCSSLSPLSLIGESAYIGFRFASPWPLST